MPENARLRGPLATVRRMLVFSSAWAVMGVIEILFTVVGHDSGGLAMIGVFSLVTAAAGFAGSLEQRRRERSDSIR
jgi:hypothetical protein